MQEDMNNPGVIFILLEDLDLWTLSGTKVVSGETIDSAQLNYVPSGSEAAEDFSVGFEFANSDGAEYSPSSPNWDAIFKKIVRMKQRTKGNMAKTGSALKQKIQRMSQEIEDIENALKLL